MFTIGADIEVPIVKDGRFVSVVGMINGTKTHPLIVPKGNLQEDNVNAEFAIDYADNAADFCNNIITVRDTLIDHLPEGCSIQYTADNRFSDDQLQHPDAMKFGCDADFNAYRQQKNRPINTETNLRTCGGHIHVGYDDPMIDPLTLVKYMDIFLGMPSVLCSTDTSRRSMYGSAGAYRLKDYGIEYRVLDNFWIQDTDTILWVYDQVQKAVTYAREVPYVLNTDVPRSIDTYDESLAMKAINELQQGGVYV